MLSDKEIEKYRYNKKAHKILSHLNSDNHSELYGISSLFLSQVTLNITS